MTAAEALARVLEEADMRNATWESNAEYLIGNPGPLLAALAEAGVLHRVDDTGFRRSDPVERHIFRYVTAWQEVQP